MSSSQVNLSNPIIWGPVVWNFLHVLASQFKSTSDEDRQCWVNVIKSLPGVLPCKECREHFREYLAQNPVDISIASDAYTLSQWLWRAHEHVNALTGKKSIVTFSMLVKSLKVPPPSSSQKPQQSVPDSQALVVAAPVAQRAPQAPAPAQKVSPPVVIPVRPRQPAETNVSPLLNKVQQNIMTQLHNREVISSQQSPANVSSGKPPLRVKDAHIVLAPKAVEPTPAPSTAQAQEAPKLRKQPPKAIPIQQQQIILAQRAVSKQLQNHPVSSFNGQTPPIQSHQPPIVINKPIQHQQPQQQKQMIVVANPSQSQNNVKRTITNLMKGRAPIIQSTNSRPTVHQMAEALQKNGIKIRGIITRQPTIQPGIKPAQTSRALVIPTSRALAVPATLTVPRALTTTLPARKKCNCGRK